MLKTNWKSEGHLLPSMVGIDNSYTRIIYSPYAKSSFRYTYVTVGACIPQKMLFMTYAAGTYVAAATVNQ